MPDRLVRRLAGKGAVRTMIPIPLDRIFVWYFGAWFFVITLLWICDELRKRKKNMSDSVVKDRLYLCGKCNLTFLARDDREHIVRCPRCHEMCFFRQSKRF